MLQEFYSWMRDPEYTSGPSLVTMLIMGIVVYGIEAMAGRHSMINTVSPFAMAVIYVALTRRKRVLVILAMGLAMSVISYLLKLPTQDWPTWHISQHPETMVLLAHLFLNSR